MRDLHKNSYSDDSLRENSAWIILMVIPVLLLIAAILWPLIAGSIVDNQDDKIEDNGRPQVGVGGGPSVENTPTITISPTQQPFQD